MLSALLAELCLDEQPQPHLPDRPLATWRSRSCAARASWRPASRDGTGARLDLAEGEWLLNPGSVGQPRDGDPRAAWLLLDLDGMDASFHRADYDVAGAAAAIRAARLPDSLAERLEYGQ